MTGISLPPPPLPLPLSPAASSSSPPLSRRLLFLSPSLPLLTLPLPLINCMQIVSWFAILLAGILFAFTSPNVDLGIRV